MKILVISLLRLGDFMQALPVLDGLRRQYRIRELDLLTFAPVRQMEPMVPGIQRWWTLDRDGLQSGLGEADIPMLTSFAWLKETLDEIDANKYDCIVNLTQTYFSAWIAGYLHAPQRAGLTMDVRGQAQFHSPWFQYLDEHAGTQVSDVFHNTDIFFYGSGLNGPERQWRLQETKAGRAEVAALRLPKGEKIVLQMLTSENKKNWSTEAWLQMMRELHQSRPNASFVLLGAPNESSTLQAVHGQSQREGLPTVPAILSLAGALTLLKQAQLLITGDTSIKHLANATDIPVLELSLGSSDWRRTGAYKSNTYILQAKVACAPCPHSAPCSQARHECALQLKPSTVALTANYMLNASEVSLNALAKADTAVQILRGRPLTNGFWMAHDITAPDPQRLVTAMVERCTWKFLLNREYLDPLARFGTETVQLKQEIDGLLDRTRTEGLLQHLDFLEQDTTQAREQAALSLKNARHRRLLPNTDGAVDISGPRRENQVLERAFNLTQVKLKLIRALKFQLMEGQ